jgi:alpha-L-fucosidase
MHRRDFLQCLGAGVAGTAVTARTPLPALSRPAHFAGPPPDRLDWWREARFGMFVHFGLYSILGGEWQGRPAGSHEWIRNNAKIPHEEYIRLLDRFDPARFQADEWVSLAKEAGQRYLVITTKHHEGFSLFDSARTTYDVMSTPFRRDIMREIADACRRHGIRIGWYYSIMDWYHPDYLPRRDWESRDAAGADFRRYLEFMRAQLRELLTNYGDIAILWFDGQWEATWNHALGTSLYDWCLSLAPDVIINDRIDAGVTAETIAAVGRPRAGDFGTPEQEVPATGLAGVDWESCMTMNDNWGWAKFDHNWKSAEQLVLLLVETASKGGNLLLNVGPMGDGRIPEESVSRLREIGRWMRAHGAAIYGTTASPFTSAPFRVTAGPHRLNVFIHEWRPGEFELPGLRTSPRSATLLADPRAGALRTRVTGTGVAVTLPDRAPPGFCPVVTLEFDETPRVGA